MSSFSQAQEEQFDPHKSYFEQESDQPDQQQDEAVTCTSETIKKGRIVDHGFGYKSHIKRPEDEIECLKEINNMIKAPYKHENEKLKENINCYLREIEELKRMLDLKIWRIKKMNYYHIY